MKILALDSSAGYACAALLENRTLLYEVRDLSGRAHSETLLPLVASMLEMHHLAAHDIDLFACTTGPGSYTGVRIGVATVKGLASGSGKPCIGLSSLEVLAQNGAMTGGLVCAAMDARSDRFFAALFENKKGILTRLTPDAALTAEKLDALLKKHNRIVYFTGDGSAKAMKMLSFSGKRLLPPLAQSMSAYAAGLLGYEKYATAPALAVDEGLLTPTYLGLTQAERERNEKLKNERH